jgi:hypothetical protein
LSYYSTSVRKFKRFRRDRLRAVRLPLILLLAYGLAFAAAGPGVSTIGFDDHPGQIYRAWHVLARGPAPWVWNPGWWGGYPELQFYPPGFAYLAALLAWLTQGTLALEAIYQALVWLAYLAPGVTTWLALTRLTRDGWLALPAAFVALSLSGGVASGVEGGVRVGMVGARLSWALLPVLLAVLVPWIEHARRLPLGVPLLLAAIVLLHPAQAPSAVALLALAALAREPRAPRARAVLGGVALAAGLIAFWAVPLLARLAHTRALAWGALTLADATRALPLALLILAAIALAWRDAAAATRVAALWLPATVALVLADGWIAEPLGARWLPADRVADGAWMALIVGAGLGAVRLARAAPTAPRPALALAAVAALAVFGLHGQTLMLWPRAGAWPSLASIERGVRLTDFWRALTPLPEGRVLFVRSGVPLVFGTEWWRPHSHATALTPRAAGGREIIGGTFTHPSPVAALVYRGDAGPGAITRLAEQADGRTLFGEPLGALDRARFSGRVDRLGVVAVVTLEDDAASLGWLAEDARFSRRLASPPFVVYARSAAAAVPLRQPDATWRVTLDGAAGAWASARIAYYPLWRAMADGLPLATRRGDDGVLEVRLGATPQLVTLSYAAGAPEWLGVAITAASIAVAALLVAARR